MAKPLGPYSPLMDAGDLVFVSGQVGIVDGGLVDGGVEAEARQALSNLGALLASTDLTLADVVKCTVFLTSMDDFAAVNAIYAEVFGETRPARSCVAVAALPAGAAFEIEAIARG